MASRQEATRTALESRQTLTRADVTSAAIALVERDGLETLTMRRLAAELGCAPMSLYTHVRNRDDLVDAIVSQLIERLGLREVPGESWQDAVRRTLRAYRELAVDVPHAFELLALAPYDSAPVAPHLANVVGGLERAGLDREQARQILGIVDGYATGFLVVWARGRAARSGTSPADESSGPGAAIAPDVAGMRDLATFDQGLEALIAGLDATLVQTTDQSRHP